MTKSARAPRPYSRLNPATGRVEWVTPGTPSSTPNLRSRLETDAEVRRRLIPLIGVFSMFRLTKLHGKELDAELKENGLEPRKMIDEVQP